jgi:hypothetical protein
MASGAMGDDPSKRIHKLRFREILNLFGRVRKINGTFHIGD